MKASGHIRLDASVTKPVAEAVGSEGFAVFRHHEGSLVRRDFAQHDNEFRQHRDINVHGGAVLILGLGKLEPRAMDVARSKPHCIFAAAGGTQHEGEGKAGLGPNGVLRFEAFHLLDCPGMMPGGLIGNQLDILCGIGVDLLGVKCPAEQRLQGLEALVSSAGFIRELIDQPPHVL